MRGRWRFLLILRVICKCCAHLPACCGSLILAHVRELAYSEPPRDIRRIIAYDITSALTNVLERMPTLRRFIMPVNEMWTNTRHQYISDYGLSPARGAPSRVISLPVHRPAAGPGTRPTSEVHLQLSIPLSAPPTPRSLMIIPIDGPGYTYTLGIQICLRSFFATFRPFDSCDRLSL